MTDSFLSQDIHLVEHRTESPGKKWQNALMMVQTQSLLKYMTTHCLLIEGALILMRQKVVPRRENRLLVAVEG